MQTRFTLPFLFFFFLLNTGFAQEWQELGLLEGAEQVTVLSNEAGYNFMHVQVTGEYFRRHKDDSAWELIYIPDYLDGPFRIKVGQGSNLYAFKWGNQEWNISTDNGDTWETMEHPLPMTVINLFEDLGDGTLIVANTNKIYRSADGGESWELVFTATQSAGYEKFTTHPITGEHFVFSKTASQGAMIYSSANDGITWSTYAIVPNINDMAMHPATGQLYLATDEGVKNQLPGEANFSLMNEQPTDLGVLKLDFLPSGRLMTIEKTGNFFGDAYFSDNSGITWQKVASPESTSLANFQVTPSGEIFGFRQGLVCSRDNGETWELDMEGVNNGLVYDHAETATGIQFVASNTGVFRSYDGGQSWERITRNYSRAIPYVEVDANDRLYIYRQNRLLISTDEGGSFTEIDGPEIGYIFNLGELAPKFTIHPSGTFFVLGREEVFRSADNGLTWTASPCPANSWGIQTTGNGTLVIGGVSSFMVSEDNGETWATRQYPTGTSPEANNFFVFKDGLITFIHSDFTDHRLYKSPDFGITWTFEDCSHGPVNDHTNFFINDANYLFIPGVHNLLKYSVDRGNHWWYLPDAPLQSLQRIFLTKDHQIIINSHKGQSYQYDASFASLTGRLMHEEDFDCLAQADDVPVEGWKVMATGGNFDYYGYSDANGQFIMPVRTGDFNIQPVPPNHLWEVCTKDVTLTQQNLYSEHPMGDLSVNALFQCPYMTVDVTTAMLRRCFDGTFTVRYSNTGTVTAENASVVLNIDKYLDVLSSSIPIDSQNGREFTFQLGDVEPNKSGSFKVDFNVSCDAELSQWHCVEAAIFPNEICGDFPDWTGSIIEVEGFCQTDGTVFTITNVGDGDMVKPMPYFIHDEDGTVEFGTYQLSAGESLIIPVDQTNGLFIRLIDETGYPYQGIPSAIVSDCDKGALHWDWAFSNLHLGDSEPFRSSFCLENRGAYDPNDKTAFPAGFGDDHLLEANVPIDYLIRFQNTGTDTAFKVVIVDTLSQWLDPASVELGASSHPFSFEMSGSRDDRGVVLKFIFDNIMLPDSNINEAASHGFVKFHIRQLPDNAIGTRIENEAAIYFDFNEPIITNTAWHTIGEDFYPVVSDVEHETSIAGNLEIMPNPFIATTLIRLAGMQAGEYQIKVLDLAGKELFSDYFAGDAYLLQNNELPSGMLMVGIYRNGMPIVFDKMIKVKD